MGLLSWLNLWCDRFRVRVVRCLWITVGHLQSRFFRALCSEALLLTLLGSTLSPIYFLSASVFSCVCIYRCALYGVNLIYLPYVPEENIFGMSCPVDSVQSKERGWQPSMHLYWVPLLVAPGSYPSFLPDLSGDGGRAGFGSLPGAWCPLWKHITREFQWTPFSGTCSEVVLPHECWPCTTTTCCWESFISTVPAYDMVMIFLFHFLLSDFWCKWFISGAEL